VAAATAAADANLINLMGDPRGRLFYLRVAKIEN